MKTKNLNNALTHASRVFRQLSSAPHQNLKQKEAYISQNILDVLVWKYNVSKKEYKLISSDFGHNGVMYSQFNKFLEAIKPCFQDFFINYFTSYINFIADWEIMESYSQYQLQGFIPVQLGSGGYLFSTLYITPEVTAQKELVLYIALLPLKEHVDEVLTLNVLNNGKKDDDITQQIKNKVSLHTILTEEQALIFNLILLGYSSKKIASFLDKKQENILKYNLRINNRLSSFFDISFNSAIDAATYYKKCFLLS